MKNTFLARAADPFRYLFWKAQISAMRACPPLCGVVARVSLGAANSRAVWLKTLLRVAAQAPRAVLRNGRDRREGRVVLPRATVFVTTRCTLNCDKCAARIPSRACRGDLPAPELLEDLRTLLARVDYIYVLFLSGGEPFLHPDLGEFIRLCAASDKTGAVSVVTNGTVIPGEKTLAALREPKVIVKISRYGPALQPRAERLKEVLRENGIPFTHESGTAWSDMGGDGQLKPGSAVRRFGVCTEHLCFAYYHGRLHLCGESALWAEEGIVPECAADYADLRATGPEEFREQFRGLLKKRAVTACAYCLGNTYKTPRVPVAVQRER